MNGRVVDGRALAEEMIAFLKGLERKRQTTKANGAPRTLPVGGLGKLVVLGVGATKSDFSFLRSITRLAAELGIVVEQKLFRRSVQLEIVTAQLDAFGKDPSVGGVVVLDGFGASIDRRLVAAAIPSQKDPECVSEKNLGLLANSRYCVIPPAVMAMNTALSKTHIGVPIGCVNVVVVGAGKRVGRPIIHWLTSGDTTITVLRSTSTVRDCASTLRHADIIIGAASKAGALDGYFLKRGAVVVDFGFPPNCDALQLARLGITVVCNVGPMVTASLLHNFLVLNT